MNLHINKPLMLVTLQVLQEMVDILAPRLASVDAAAQLFACGHAGEIVWQQQGKSVSDVLLRIIPRYESFCMPNMWPEHVVGTNSLAGDVCVLGKHAC